MDLYFVGELELDQIFMGARVNIRIRQAEKPVEQVEIGKYHRKMIV
jgi:hypothetical protein